MAVPSATIGGEITRIYLANKDSKANMGVAAASVITSRILSTIVYTSGLLFGSIILVTTQKMPLYLMEMLLLLSAVTAGIIGAILYVTLKEGATKKLVNIVMRVVRATTKNQVKLKKWKEKLEGSLFSFSEAFQTYKERPKTLIKPAIFAVVSWLFTLLLYMMVFYSLNFKSVSMVDLAVVYFVSSTVETLTSGFPVGAVEATMVSLYSALGVPLVVAGAATTLTRLLTFWAQVMVGYPILQLTGLKHILKKDFFHSLKPTKPTAGHR